MGVSYTCDRCGVSMEPPKPTNLYYKEDNYMYIGGFGPYYRGVVTGMWCKSCQDKLHKVIADFIANDTSS